MNLDRCVDALRVAFASLAFVSLYLGASMHAARADVYKWVDKNGVTNYSAEAPKDGKGVKKVDVVEERMSSYAPDPALTSAMSANARMEGRAEAERIASLQRQLEAERLARQNVAAAGQSAEQAAHGRCVAERRVDCDAGTQQAVPVILVGRSRRQARVPPIVPTVPLNGVTAGNVTQAISAGGGNVNRTPGALK